MNNCKKFQRNKVIALPRRNPMHNHPLLSKGSMHVKTNKAIRRKQKIVIKKEWLPQILFLRVEFWRGFSFIANK